MDGLGKEAFNCYLLNNQQFEAFKNQFIVEKKGKMSIIILLMAQI